MAQKLAQAEKIAQIYLPHLPLFASLSDGYFICLACRAKMSKHMAQFDQINADQFIGIGIVSTRQNVASVMDNMQTKILRIIYLSYHMT